jgi:DAPG hydrolase PhiG domain
MNLTIHPSMKTSTNTHLRQHVPSVTVLGQTWQPDASIYTSEVAVAAARAGLQPATQAITLAETNRLLDAGYLSMETGYARLDNGMMYVSALTDMPGVTGEMIDWWFAWHDTDKAYTLWHPRDHIEAVWKLPVDRSLPLREQYIGNTSQIIEYIGSTLEHLNVFFQPPKRYFDTSRFTDSGIATAVCARGGKRLENVWTAHLIHLIRKTPHGVEMRSRFWLGDVDASPKGPIGKLLTPLMNTAMMRKRNIPDHIGRDLMLHCAEEMHHLAVILPELYRRFGSA